MSNYYQPTSNVSLLKQLFGTTYAFDSNANEFKTKINLALPGDLAIGSADTSYNLYVNGNAVATTLTISQTIAAGVAKWAEYPAVRYVDLAGFNIINASNIVTTNISTDTINGLPVDASGGAGDSRLVITAADSIYIGLSSGSNDGGASRSIGIGYSAAFNSSGDSVVALGDGAAESNSQSHVVALGNYAAIENEGANVCAIGRNAGTRNTGVNVTVIGYNSGLSNTGDNVTMIGSSAGTSNSGENVVAIGVDAADENTNIHVNCLGSNAGRINTGSSLNAFGRRAGESNTGSNVNALGFDAGYRNSGDQVSFFGTDAGQSNSGNNVFAGGGGAASENTGSSVCAIGFSAAQSNTGDYVIMIGYQAGSNSVGSNVIAVGKTAGVGNSGENVVFMGNDAGSNNSGSNVIAFGTRAANANTGSNCIFIGQDAGGENGLNNQLAIGNLITGDFSSGEVTISNINVTNINGAPYSGGGGATVGIHVVKDISDIMSSPAAPILWTASIWSNGMDLSGDQVFASQSGTYRVDYEMLIEANNSPLIATWLRKGETDIDGTTTLTRNDTGNILQPTNTSVVNLSAGDSIDVMLCTANASMDAVFLFVEPNVVPGCPSGYSARMTITKLA